MFFIFEIGEIGSHETAGKFSHPTPGLWCVRCPRISCPAFFEADIEEFCFDRRIVANRDHSATEFPVDRSEEHTSELQSLMRISYAVFCLKKKNKQKRTICTDKHSR